MATHLTVCLFGLLLPLGVSAQGGSAFSMQASADLDGDGRRETIRLEPLTQPSGGFDLVVDGARIRDRLDDRVDGLSIVDIDTRDHHREVAVHTPGPSDDDQYFYFWYDNGELHRVGKVERWPTLLGDGIVLVRDWCASTWERTRKYVLDPDHHLRHVPQEVYWVGLEGWAGRSFPLYSRRDGDAMQATVREGSDLLIVACDCIGDWDEWSYLIKTEHGQLGWLRDGLHDIGGLPVAD